MTEAIKTKPGEVIYYATPDQLDTIAEMLDAGCSADEIRAELARKPNFFKRAVIIAVVYIASIYTIVMAVYGTLKLFGVC